MAVNAYEELARERKARKLAVLLATHGIDAEMVRAMSDYAWEVAAAAADVNMPSAESRELVASMLEAAHA